MWNENTNACIRRSRERDEMSWLPFDKPQQFAIGKNTAGALAQSECLHTAYVCFSTHCSFGKWFRRTKNYCILLLGELNCSIHTGQRGKILLKIIKCFADGSSQRDRRLLYINLTSGRRAGTLNRV